MNKLREQLLTLKTSHNLVSVKGGTEVEGMTFDEIKVMREISRGIVPMIVKIGGPEARNDIEFMLENGIDIILSPMIESVYALKNFVETMKNLSRGRKANLAINIETITGYDNLDKIIQADSFTDIDMVTVGRSDLSASIGKNVDDDEVVHMSREIVMKCKRNGKHTSTGGKVMPLNAHILQEQIKPDYINTRNMMISSNSLTIADDITMILKWEKAFYEYLANNRSDRQAFYQDRIKSAEDRLNKSGNPYIAGR